MISFRFSHLSVFKAANIAFHCYIWQTNLGYLQKKVFCYIAKGMFVCVFYFIICEIVASARIKPCFPLLSLLRSISLSARRLNMKIFFALMSNNFSGTNHHIFEIHSTSL